MLGSIQLSAASHALSTSKPSSLLSQGTEVIPFIGLSRGRPAYGDARESQGSSDSILGHLENTFTYAERVTSHHAVTGGHNSSIGRTAPLGRGSPVSILDHFEKTFAHVESVMSQPAVFGGRNGSFDSAGKGAHRIRNGPAPRHQSFLSQLATRSKKMSMPETLLAAAGFAGLLFILAWGVSSMITCSK